MTLDWYEVVTDTGDLEQGDLLFDMPAPRVLHDAPTPGKVTVQLIRATWVVLSQTCDLENNKIPQVLLAVAKDYDEFARESNDAKRTEFRKALVQGVGIAYALLPERTLEPTVGWTIVDFHHLRLMDKHAVEKFASTTGARLRLKSPYKNSSLRHTAVI